MPGTFESLIFQATTSTEVCKEHNANAGASSDELTAVINGLSIDCVLRLSIEPDQNLGTPLCTVGQTSAQPMKLKGSYWYAELGKLPGGRKIRVTYDRPQSIPTKLTYRLHEKGNAQGNKTNEAIATFQHHCP